MSARNRRAFSVIVGIAVNVLLAAAMALFVHIYSRLQSLHVTSNDKFTRDAEVLRIICYTFLPWVGVGNLLSCFLFWRLRKSE